MSFRTSFVFAMVGLICCPTILVGCGSSDGPCRAAASGKVTFDGEPLKNGTIRFVPTTPESPTKSAEIVAGRFDLTAEMGPVVGANCVEIEAKGPGAFDDEKLMIELEASGANKGPVRRKKFDVPVIPAKYNSQTELTATVVEGQQNYFEFDLRSK